MKKVMPFIVVVSALIISQASFAGTLYAEYRASNVEFETAFVPAQVAADVVEVVADELLNLK